MKRPRALRWAPLRDNAAALLALFGCAAAGCGGAGGAGARDASAGAGGAAGGGGSVGGQGGDRGGGGGGGGGAGGSGAITGSGGAAGFDGGLAGDHGAGGAGAAPVTSLRNVDVTIVYPLPAAADLDALLAPAALGIETPLRDLRNLDDRDALTAEAQLASLRVVAVRFDPCSDEVSPPPPGAICAPRIRLVLQSLKVMPPEATAIARDGAIHTFFALTPAELENVVHTLRGIRSEHLGEPQVPLDVHPLLVREGPRGAYATRLRALLLAHARLSNLVRVTAFRRLAPSYPPVWVFSQRERTGDVWTDVVIPTTSTLTQTVMAISGGRWDADVTPPLAAAEDPTFVLSAGVAERAEGVAMLARMLNPRVHSARTISCAACHLAPDVTLFEGAAEIARHPDRFQSAYPLDVRAKDSGDVARFDNIHMTSYSGRSLSLSARTANETAAVLEALNR